MTNKDKELPTTSRTGRDNQRYNDSGERLVCGLVPLNRASDQVLLIESAKRTGWVLPKGGWETDETPQAAALREAWEEAGVVCALTRDLGTIADSRPDSELTVLAPRASFRFFEAVVESEEETWPEMAKRGRRWMRFDEARDKLKARPELREALERSGLKR